METRRVVRSTGLRDLLFSSTERNEPNRQEGHTVRADSSSVTSDVIVITAAATPIEGSSKLKPDACSSVLQKLLLHYLFTALLSIMLVYCFIQLSAVKYELDVLRARIDRRLERPVASAIEATHVINTKASFYF